VAVACGDVLELDGRVSSHLGARANTVAWRVAPADPAVEASALDAFLRALPLDQEVVAVPAGLLAAGARYTFVLTVTDFLGQVSAPAEHTVDVLPASAVDAASLSPAVQIFGAGVREFTVTRALALEGAAAPPACLAAAFAAEAANATAFAYTWTLSPAPRVALPAARMHSVELYLPAGTLDSGTTYTATLSATHPRLLAGAGSASVTLQPAAAVAGTLTAIIAGDTQTSAGLRVVSAGAALVLDATPSTDALGSTDPVRYEWRCVLLGSAGACIDQRPSPKTAFAFTFDGRVTVPAAALAPNTYVFTVTVSKGARSSTVSATITLVAPGVPQVDVTGVFAGLSQRRVVFEQLSARGLHAGETLTLRAVVSVSPAASAAPITSYAWTTVVGAGLEAADLAGIAGSSSSSASLTSNVTRKHVPLVLPKDFLRPGAYRFRLTASNSAGSGIAEVAVLVRAGPSGGTFAVSPANGTALVTLFTWAAAGWADALTSGADVRYQAGYADAAGDVHWLGPASQSALVTRQLPGAAVHAVLGIVDSEGARTVQWGAAVTVETPAAAVLASAAWLDAHVAHLRQLAAEGAWKSLLGDITAAGRALSAAAAARGAAVAAYRDSVVLLLRGTVTADILLRQDNAAAVLDAVRALLFNAGGSWSAEARAALSDILAAVTAARRQRDGEGSSDAVAGAMRRRSVDASVAALGPGLDPIEAAIVLDAYAVLIDPARYDTTTLALKAAFVAQVTEVSALLCRTMTLGQAAVGVAGLAAALRVAVVADGAEVLPAPVAPGLGSSGMSGSVVLGLPLAAAYADWQCAADVAAAHCQGVCVVLAALGADYTLASLSEPAHRRASDIVQTTLVNQEQSTVLTLPANIPAPVAQMPLTVQSAAANTTDASFECRAYSGTTLAGTWDASGCRVVTRVVGAGEVTAVTCTCTNVGVQAAAFNVAAAVVTPTGQLPQTPFQREYVLLQVTFLKNYFRTDATWQNGWLLALTYELASVLNCAVDRLANAHVVSVFDQTALSGTSVQARVSVVLRIVYPSLSYKGDTDTLFALFKTIVADSDFAFSFDGTTYHTQPGSVVLASETTSGKDSPRIILGVSVAFGLLALIGAFVFVYLRVRGGAEKRRVSPSGSPASPAHPRIVTTSTEMAPAPALGGGADPFATGQNGGGMISKGPKFGILGAGDAALPPMTLVNGDDGGAAALSGPGRMAALPPLSRPPPGGMQSGGRTGPMLLPSLNHAPHGTSPGRIDLGGTATLASVLPGITSSVDHEDSSVPAGPGEDVGGDALDRAALRNEAAELDTNSNDNEDAESDDAPCHKCGQPSAFACARCNLQFYCSAVCQRADWGEHRAACKQVRRRNSKESAPVEAATVVPEPQSTAEPEYLETEPAVSSTAGGDNAAGVDVDADADAAPSDPAPVLTLDGLDEGETVVDATMQFTPREDPSL
jgi:hypothetical protein